MKVEPQKRDITLYTSYSLYKLNRNSKCKTPKYRFKSKYKKLKMMLER